MADIRIKDITTTASASLTGDVFVIDGTTGTRKLSAFSPTFGGNATVTGTLTVNGTGASSFGGRLAIGATALSDRMFYVSGSTGTTGASQFSAVVNPTIPNTVTTSAYGLYLGTNIAAGATVTNGYSLFIAAPDYTGSTVTNKYGLYSNDPNPSYFVGNVLVGSTTASTSTSSGALVVSGGVGVGGAIVAGGAITTGNDVLDVAIYVPGNTAIRTKDGSSTKLYIDTKTVDGGDIVLRPRAATALTLAAGTGNVSIAATTASTSTSSGALVVSGGVGVAGAMNVGSQLKVTNSSIPDLWLQNTSGATSAYRNILIRQNSDDTFKFLSTSDAGVLSKDNILTGNNATGAIGIGVAPGSGTSSLTIAGNLAVSGTQNTFGLPSSASALGTNSTMTFELTSNTSLKIFVRGSDGTTRSTTLTLA